MGAVFTVVAIACGRAMLPSKQAVEDARYICIEGPIGAGKSTLAKILAERTDSRLVTEPDDENPLLERFYSDERKHAFQTQLFYLLSRFQQQGTITQGDLFK